MSNSHVTYMQLDEYVPPYFTMYISVGWFCDIIVLRLMDSEYIQNRPLSFQQVMYIIAILLPWDILQVMRFYGTKQC